MTIKQKKGVNEKSIANLKKGGVIPRDVLYKQMSRLTPKAIERLDQLMDNPNPSVQLGAVNKVLDKTLPDQKPDIVVNQQFNDNKTFVLPSELLEKYDITSDTKDSSKR